MSHCLGHKLEHVIITKVGFVNTILNLTASSSFLRFSSIVILASILLLNLLVLNWQENDEMEDISMCKNHSTQTFRHTTPVSKHKIYWTQKPTSIFTPSASLHYPEVQKFSPHSHIILFKHPTSIFSPGSKFFL